MALFEDGFRLFFLATAGLAVVHIALWLSYLFGSGAVPTGWSPVVWHGHELVFGFASALIAGFLLTAVGNWTGRKVAAPGVIVTLFALWLVARVGMAWPVMPDIVVTLLAAAFLPVLTVVVAIPIIASSNLRNYPVVVILVALSLAGAMLHLSRSLVVLHAALDVVMILTVLVGSRIIPFFTSRRLPETAIRAGRAPDLAAAALVVAAVIAGWSWPQAPWLPALQVAAGLALLVQLVRWKVWTTWREPMLWILHLGYLWIAVSLLLRAAPVPPTIALHAFTVGALGCLAIGMMTRVALGHTGRPVYADTWMVCAFALVALAAVPRLAFPLLPFDLAGPSLTLAGVLWAAGFLIYFVRFLPVMTAPRR